MSTVGQTNKRGLAAFVIMIFAAIIIINQWLQKSVQEITRHPAQTPVAATPAPVIPAEPYRQHGQKVLRKDRLSPGRDYTESVFYLDDTEVARQRIANETVI